MLKFSIIGYLGKNCEIKDAAGKTLLDFSVATSEKVKDGNGGYKDKTTWISCAYFVNNTNLAPYLVKGCQVYCEGRGELRQWTSQDGKAGANLSMVVTNIQLLGNGNNQSQGSSEQNFKQNLGNKSTDFNDADSAPF